MKNRPIRRQFIAALEALGNIFFSTVAWQQFLIEMLIFCLYQKTEKAEWSTWQLFETF